eukprot:1188660-Pyramimonas_sp.AAC.1
MSRDAMVQCFLHAAVLTSSPWLGRRAVPEKVSTSTASRSTKPRCTRRNLMARSISPSSFFTNLDLRANLEAMMFDAFEMSCSWKTCCQTMSRVRCRGPSMLSRGSPGRQPSRGGRLP